MKTLLFIIGVLVIMTEVYSINEKRLRNFYTNLGECCHKYKHLPEDKPAIEGFVCALKKDGKYLDENGEISRRRGMLGLEESISDIKKLNRALRWHEECQQEAKKSGVHGDEQVFKIAECIYPAVYLFDNFEIQQPYIQQVALHRCIFY